MRPIDLLVPEVFAHEGGIQVYSRTLIRALRQLRPHTPLRVFSRNDHPRHLPANGWEGVEWHPAAGSSWRLAASLFRAARGRRPLLLLSTHANYAPLQWLHHRLVGSPSWCTAHGIEVWSLRPGPRRWALVHLQQLLPVSRFTAESLRRQLAGRCPPLAVLPNSYDAQRFHPGAPSPALLDRYGLKQGQPVVFSLTRLSVGDRAKHLDRLIQAMLELRSSIPDVVLLIGGEGADRPRLQGIVQSLGLGDCVLLPGQIAADELPDHYRLARVFALPSEKEGFGIVFLEALGCGCRVLAGNRDGSRDPLADGRFGLLVDPDQPLAAPLRQLLAAEGETLWFEPVALSLAVAKHFAFPAFCERLNSLLTGEASSSILQDADILLP
jgi:glycosyltransferase involved in cell wall biosynthesis